MADYLDQSCNRCGSKRIVEKTWKEKIETFAGTSEIEISNIICTNKECQKAFEQTLAEENIRRAEMMKKKDEQAQARKENNQRLVEERKIAQMLLKAKA